ncbi:methane monooxygenase/ammonia monooxygenase subunit C [Lentzea sp. NPDC051838]|uniref:methane monooxygenase/ammonia monooxygenase subunit C n=1 Tax=Lentzea sp. NPDC051838 TaxID=3154849 RepID=UPI003436E707
MTHTISPPSKTESEPPEIHERPGRGPIDWLGGWKTLFIASALLAASFIGLRIYQGYFAWWNEAGLNSKSPAFTKYWFSLFIIEVLLAGAITLSWWGWLAKKGKQLVDKPITHREEVRRIAVFWGLVGATCVVLYFMASFFPNQDGVWHQTAVRDTALTPSHIVMFFWAFPLGITMTVGTYLYGRFWLPKVYGAQKGFPWSFFLLIAASVTEMMQVAMNEWGHSLWITEEIFAAPFHWPFVTYGWLASGIFACWAETLGRLLQIEDELPPETRTETVAEAPARTAS